MRSFNSIYTLIFITCVFHLITINFAPTNFEGAIGVGANFFHAEDKLTFLKIYFTSQFNSIAFSFIGALIREIFPFLDANQCIRILSALSYLFLILAISNLSEFIFKKKIRIEILLLIIINPIVWHYGHRMYVGLFSYSLSLFAFSQILISKKNIFRYFFYLLLSIGIVIKPFNLFLVPISILIYYYKNSFNLKTLINSFIFLSLSILVPVIYYFLTFTFLGDFIVPDNEDLKIAVFSNDKARDIKYVLNNFIFYIGYLQLITLPFALNLDTFKQKLNIKNFTVVISLFLIFLYLPSFIGISAELDFGPLQRYIPYNIYILIISFTFVLFLYQNINIISNSNLLWKQRKIFALVVALILIYFLCLSFIKGSQRYIIPAIPIYLLLYFNLEFIKNKVINFLTIFGYLFLNIILLVNYFIVGESSRQIKNFIIDNDIIFNTHPGVATPHLFHLYQNEKNLISGQPMYLEDLQYNIVTDQNQIDYIFKSSVNFFKIEVNKFILKKND